MLQLQFVEINGEDRSIQPLLKQLHIIGHSGDIAPKICNGRISRRHATVTLLENSASWLIVDGVGGHESKNGLWHNNDRVNGEVEISKVGDRVYLLPGDGLAAYLEIVRVSPKDVENQSTLDLDDQIQQIRGTIETALDVSESAETLAKQNKQRIDEVDDRIDGVLDAIERVGSNPWKFFIGGAVVFGLLFGGVTLWGLYSNLDKLIDYQIQKHQAK